MNVLIYSHIPLCAIQHAESAELALKHIAKKDTVYFLSCDGALKSCPANPFHLIENCAACRKQTAYTLKRILKRGVHDLRLKGDFTSAVDVDLTSLETLCDFELKQVPFGGLLRLI